MTAGSVDAGPIVATILVRTLPSCSLWTDFIESYTYSGRSVLMARRLECRSILDDLGEGRRGIASRPPTRSRRFSPPPERQTQPGSGGRGDRVAHVDRSVRKKHLSELEHRSQAEADQDGTRE